MTAKKTVMIVDDHPVFREGIKALIGKNPRYEVIAEAGEARTALELAQKIQPDIMIVDLSLPDRSGIELIRELQGRLPKVRSLVLSMHSKADYIASAFQSGARGYVVKESAAENLIAALDAMARDDYYMDSAVSAQVVEKLMQKQPGSPKITDSNYDSLTAREQEIMALLAEGHSVREIAERLHISQKTVENHRSNIYSKLEIHNSIELMRYAVRLGIVDVELWR
ncbi:MAG TPA: response regulator [Desulfobacterales bacterium]